MISVDGNQSHSAIIWVPQDVLSGCSSALESGLPQPSLMVDHGVHHGGDHGDNDGRHDAHHAYGWLIMNLTVDHDGHHVGDIMVSMGIVDMVFKYHDGSAMVRGWV
jgi:hypothetical protein|mmetsp:Transcript_34866/g.58279  ORF Transcript_34866/g.58279 Transcript_34866/m.58279 type:complete len:106 (-) Transcript_34866:100-417(-)